MSDNLTLNPARSGEIIAAEDIDGVKFLKVAGTSALNSTFAESSQALTARAITEERLISEGLFHGRSIVTKFGRNPDIDTATAPEDLWNGGGVYTGFPTGAAEEFEVLSDSANDTGQLTFNYLASATATEYQQATVTLNGTTPVATGVTGIRCHTASYNNANASTFNEGTITVRHRVTTANVFIRMPVGRSQSNNAGYTIPFGSRGFIKRFFVREISNVTGYVEGALWARESGKSPRLRRPFSVGTGGVFEENVYGGLVLPALTDIHIRVLTASNNNMAVTGGFDIIVVPD